MNIYFTPGNYDSEQAALQKLHAALFTPAQDTDEKCRQGLAAHSHLSNAIANYRFNGYKTYRATNPETNATAFLRIVSKQ